MLMGSRGGSGRDGRSLESASIVATRRHDVKGANRRSTEFVEAGGRRKTEPRVCVALLTSPFHTLQLFAFAFSCFFFLPYSVSETRPQDTPGHIENPCTFVVGTVSTFLLPSDQLAERSTRPPRASVLADRLAYITHASSLCEPQSLELERTGYRFGSVDCCLLLCRRR